jgi:hypothetical protein
MTGKSSGFDMTYKTYKLRLTVNENADPELAKVLENLDARRRSYRILELAKQGLRIEEKLNHKLEAFIESKENQHAQSGKPPHQPRAQNQSNADDDDPFTRDLLAFVVNDRK